MVAYSSLKYQMLVPVFTIPIILSIEIIRSIFRIDAIIVWRIFFFNVIIRYPNALAELIETLVSITLSSHRNISTLHICTYLLEINFISTIIEHLMWPCITILFLFGSLPLFFKLLAIFPRCKTIACFSPFNFD